MNGFLEFQVEVNTHSRALSHVQLVLPHFYKSEILLAERHMSLDYFSDYDTLKYTSSEDRSGIVKIDVSPEVNGVKFRMENIPCPMKVKLVVFLGRKETESEESILCQLKFFLFLTF